MGIITGWKILEDNVTSTQKLVKANNKEMLFNLLLNDRIDVAVYDKRQGQVLLQKLHHPKEIYISTSAFSVNEMYLYLHKKHADLVTPLVNTLQEMKEDGTFQKLRDEAFHLYLINIDE